MGCWIFKKVSRHSCSQLSPFPVSARCGILLFPSVVGLPSAPRSLTRSQRCLSGSAKKRNDGISVA
jgi:hypothetical protein